MSDKKLTVQNNRDELQETTRDRHYITPAVDIYESDDVLTLVADLPGIDKEALDINVDQGVLTLSARLAARTEEKSLYHEFEPSGYHRQFRLHEEFDAAKADAKLKNGVLTLKLPKAEAARPQKIAVKALH